MFNDVHKLKISQEFMPTSSCRATSKNHGQSSVIHQKMYFADYGYCPF